MLVLSRKLNEEIIIRTPQGQEIRLQVTETKSDRTKIGLQADQSIQIMRRELLEAVG